MRAPPGSKLKLLAGAALLLLFGVWLTLAVWVSGAGASAQKHAPSAFFTGLPRVLNIAHRGASAQAAEHTFEAYALALSEGADVLELDLQMTRDRVLLVAHDKTLERTVGISASIPDMSWNALNELAGERTPLRLEDVFRQFPNAHYNLEIKQDRDDVATALAELIARHALEERVLVASYHYAALAAFRTASGGRIATSASMRESLTFLACYLLEQACASSFVALQLPASFPFWVGSGSFHRFAHAQGLKLHYWTVDDPEQMRALIAAGADGIMTNHPERLALVLTAAPHGNDPHAE